MWGWSTLETTVQDVRLTVRLLAKHPSFSATVLGTVALGIACTTTIFTFVDALLLRALPVRQPQQLVAIGAPGRNLDLNPSYFSQPFYRYLKESSVMFSDLVATSVAVTSGVNLDQGDVTNRIRIELVSGNYFQVLGIQPSIGRFFGPAEDATPDANPVVVVAHSFWQKRFGSSPETIGRTVSLNGHPFTIIGVAGPHFFGTRPGFGPDAWAPLMMVGQLASFRIQPDQPNQNYLELFARLPERTLLGNAQAAASGAFQQWLNAQQGMRGQGNSPPTPPTVALTPMPRGLSLLRGQYSEPLVILMTSVILLLLIACANVATLLLARATSRSREIAVRLSIGAGRSRIVRQMLTEAVLISTLGGLLGWVVSVYLGRALLVFLPPNAEPWQFSPKATVFLFAMGVSIVNGALFGIAPALLVSRTDLVSAIKGGNSTSISRTKGLSFRGTLSTVQVALSLMLIIAAGLFMRTLHNLRATDTGFRQTDLFLASLDPARSGYGRERLLSFFDQVQQTVREQPGVAEVALASYGTLSGVLPAGTRFMNTAVHAEGHDPIPGGDLIAYFNTVTPGYFRAVGLPIMEGRDFGAQDRAGSRKVAIINEAAAKYWFSNVNPIGKRIGPGATGVTDLQVIGVVKDAKYLSVREKTLRIVYRPLAQEPSSPMTLHVRTTSNTEAIVPYIRRAIQAVDPHVPLYNLQTIEARIDESLKQERLVSTLASMLGFLGTVLAGIGLYGMISYSVVQRTREIGTRMALGATPRNVLATFVRKALVVTVGGILCGIPLSLVAARVFSGFLYGVSPADPSTVLAATTMLLLIAALAALVPALRAARVDPLHALRQE
jgi:predicted permease